MKALVKQYYQEFVDGINFPTIIYIYETGRVISYNKQALDMLGKPVTTVTKLRAGNPTLKLSDEVLNNGHHTYYSERFRASNKVIIEIDFEVNCVKLEDQHLITVFFDYSFKQYFVRHNKYKLPRIVWFDKKHKIMGGNESFRMDFGHSENGMDFNEISECLDEETNEKLMEDREHLYSTKKPLHNMLQLIKPKNEKGFFCKIDRVPLFNKNNTVVGLLSVYMLVFNREEYEHFYSVAMRENNILNQMISKTETIAISWMKDIQYTIQYVSSNISNLGYTAQECYSGKITINDVMSDVAKEHFHENLRAIEEGPNDSFQQKAHIRKADGSFLWVKFYVGISKRNNFNYYYECFIQEIVQKENTDHTTTKSLFEISLPSRKEDVINILNSRMNRFCTYFQPIVQVRDQKIIGLEAMLRYRSDQLGFIHPKEFLTASEYLAMTVPLAEFSMRNAMQLYAKLKRPDIKVYIPVNSLQLIQPNYARLIKRLAVENNLSPENIVLEIKQSIAMEDMDLMRELLAQYKSEGFQIMIHDFNGCQVALDLINGLPIDYLKTAKSIMGKYDASGFAPYEFHDAINVINNCNIDIVVDGVELKGQHEFIKLQDVYALQGNYFCVPLSYDNLIKKFEESSM